MSNNNINYQLQFLTSKTILNTSNVFTCPLCVSIETVFFPLILNFSIVLIEFIDFSLYFIHQCYIFMHLYRIGLLSQCKTTISWKCDRFICFCKCFLFLFLLFFHFKTKTSLFCINLQTFQYVDIYLIVVKQNRIIVVN